MTYAPSAWMNMKKVTNSESCRVLMVSLNTSDSLTFHRLVTQDTGQPNPSKRVLFPSRVAGLRVPFYIWKFEISIRKIAKYSNITVFSYRNLCSVR